MAGASERAILSRLLHNRKRGCSAYCNNACRMRITRSAGSLLQSSQRETSDGASPPYKTVGCTPLSPLARCPPQPCRRAPLRSRYPQCGSFFFGFSAHLGAVAQSRCTLYRYHLIAGISPRGSPRLRGVSMSIRFAAAQAVSSISTWGLKHVFRRPAGKLPREDCALCGSVFARESAGEAHSRFNHGGGHQREDDGDQSACRRPRGLGRPRGVQSDGRESRFRRIDGASSCERGRLGRLRVRRAVVEEDDAAAQADLRASSEPVPRPARSLRRNRSHPG